MKKLIKLCLSISIILMFYGCMSYAGDGCGKYDKRLANNIKIGDVYAQYNSDDLKDPFKKKSDCVSYRLVLDIKGNYIEYVSIKSIFGKDSEHITCFLGTFWGYAVYKVEGEELQGLKEKYPEKFNYLNR